MARIALPGEYRIQVVFGGSLVTMSTNQGVYLRTVKFDSSGVPTYEAQPAIGSPDIDLSSSNVAGGPYNLTAVNNNGAGEKNLGLEVAIRTVVDSTSPAAGTVSVYLQGAVNDSNTDQWPDDGTGDLLITYDHTAVSKETVKRWVQI